MNLDLFAAYVAIGAISELLSMQNYSPGRQWATAGGILLSGAALSVMVPPAASGWVLLGLAMAGVNRVFGRVVGRLVDRVRVWADAKRERTYSAQFESGDQRQ